MILRASLSSALAGAVLAIAQAATMPSVALAANTSDTSATTTSSAQAPEGLWLTTRYPELSAQLGQDVDIHLALANQDLPPQRVSFDVSGLPDDWTWQIEGDGNPIGAAIAAPDETLDLVLRLTPGADAAIQRYDFTVEGHTDGQTLRLPIALSLTETEPARLTLEPSLPALRGTVRSTFDFQVSAKNEGQEDTIVNLLAQAQPGFEVTFKEKYGSQELTSLPIPAGETKSLTVSVKPPSDAAAGQYPVLIRVASDSVTADAQLVLDITGRPTLSLSGPEGRLSGEATAGESRTFTFKLSNTGTAPADQVKLSASPPSGWKVDFAPAEIDELAPGQDADVAVTMTPSNQAIAGDYVVSVRANGDGASDNASFRLTVRTSTVWGIAGLGIIGAAVVVLALAVTRYGRR